LIIPDARREAFGSMAKINNMKHLRLGMLRSDYYVKNIGKQFFNATIVPVDTPRDFFKSTKNDVDALVFSAESGSAWTMLYPQYSTVVPKGLQLRAPVAFRLPKHQMEYTQFINTWLQLKKENGYIDKVYGYWILGKNPKAKKIRWSVIHNVFGW
jgi:ABC-type amino acid transport substrate-binding protein